MVVVRVDVRWCRVVGVGFVVVAGDKWWWWVVVIIGGCGEW